VKVSWFLVLLCTVALNGATAAPWKKMEPGLWEFTDRLRNFEISADVTKEVENGGSGPNIQRECITEDDVKKASDSLHRVLKNPAITKRCKRTTISETPSLTDAVVECKDSIDHTLFFHTAHSFTMIEDRTFTEPLAGGGIARSAIYQHARWLRASCDK